MNTKFEQYAKERIDYWDAKTGSAETKQEYLRAQAVCFGLIDLMLNYKEQAAWKPVSEVELVNGGEYWVVTNESKHNNQKWHCVFDAEDDVFVRVDNARFCFPASQTAHFDLYATHCIPINLPEIPK